ncbi:DUF4255 domain-containing protein [Phormidium sp. LEGE 05292]|uniref:DUF4255 domain-containing protein n=1 Tax=[Phormidium] sp. LEGE 05292 TaxID=767427 RepID=UPI001881D7B8|nr:DUF4255 domain-containing protein [Phormidium sp. LEGE 05292]MBE9225448.1 DUF4255 domain-containing protein [Phormidium sp. LEGE 05292]
MSNYLAIATVTATLQRILQAAVQIDVPGARVTTVRPDASGSGTPEVGVNVYLYQATPNPAWRNADLRTRRPKGDLIKQAQAGLDLYYIMTFYGNEVELEPQRLLGSTVRTIVDQPILTAEMIRDTINNPTFSFLTDSSLAEQVERVTIVPSPMTTEDLSKIWSVFFQCPYVLSFACQGSTVLIEGQRTSGRALPIRSIDYYTTPNQPAIEQVTGEAGSNQPIVANSILVIRGKQLRGELTQVRIGDAKLTPQKLTEREIRLDLASLPSSETGSLRAGVQSLQLLHPIPKRKSYEPDRAVGSNVVPFVLCPTITADVEVLQATDNGDELYSAEVRVQIDLTVGREQRVLLFLNERSLLIPAAYIFAAKPRNTNTNLIVFAISDVKPGEYLVRVQVDGAESLLRVDTDRESSTYEQYISPKVVIP